MANSHRRSNYVEKMKIDGRIAEGNESLRQGDRDFYCKLYYEEFNWRLKLDGLNFNTLGKLIRNSIERAFTKEGIYEGAHAMQEG